MIHLSLIFSMFFRFGILGAFWIYGFIIVLKFGKKIQPLLFQIFFLYLLFYTLEIPIECIYSTFTDHYCFAQFLKISDSLYCCVSKSIQFFLL